MNKGNKGRKGSLSSNTEEEASTSTVSTSSPTPSPKGGSSSYPNANKTSSSTNANGNQYETETGGLGLEYPNVQQLSLKKSTTDTALSKYTKYAQQHQQHHQQQHSPNTSPSPVYLNSTSSASQSSHQFFPTSKRRTSANSHQMNSSSREAAMSPHISVDTRRRSSTPEVKESSILQKGYNSSGFKKVNEYTIVKEIGKGVHGKVKLCKDPDNNLYAMKIVKKNYRRRFGSRDTNPMEKIRVEIAILKKCDHPNVVKLYEVIDYPDSPKVYLVLEYLEGGSIKWKDENENPTLSISTARKYFRDILVGLQYLHFQGIVHRDIKPANLLIGSNGNVKISDFGVSHNCETEAGETSQDDDISLAKIAGTPAFLAPELCAPSGSKKIGKQIDIWSLGVTLYCFICGKLPFDLSSEYDLYQSILNDNIPLNNERISNSLGDLLLKILEKDPEKRIDIQSIKRHPWVIEDLEDPEKWINETDPSNQPAIHVTLEEVTKAVTLFQRIKSRFRRLSNQLAGSFVQRSSRRGSSDSSENFRSSSSPMLVTPKRGSLSGQSGQSDTTSAGTRSPTPDESVWIPRRRLSSQSGHLPPIKSSVSQELAMAILENQED